MKAHLTTLSNGLRVAVVRVPHAETAALSFWFDAGARHEPARLAGISHFLEHMLFKGTARRSARRISQDVEGVGGDLNAFTTEEHICLHAAAGAEFFPRLMEVLADMVLHSWMPPAEVERERGVIAEEIQMYHDEPAARVQELLSRAFWGNHPLGRPITGTLETLSTIRREDLVAFLERHRRAGSAVLAAAGPLDPGETAKLAERHFGNMPSGRASRSSQRASPPAALQAACEARDVQQTQLAVALPAPGSHDPSRFAMSLLATILAGNASSRLFQELRERRGLCYSVGGHLSHFAEGGVLTLHMGLEAKNLPRSLGLIRRELERLASEPPSTAELRRAKEYSIGAGRMALERTTSLCLRAGGSVLVYGRVVEPAETFERLRAVRPEEIQQVAQRFLLAHRAALSAVGPAADEGALREAWESGQAAKAAAAGKKGLRAPRAGHSGSPRAALGNRRPAS